MNYALGFILAMLIISTVEYALRRAFIIFKEEDRGTCNLQLFFVVLNAIMFWISLSSG